MMKEGKEKTNVVSKKDTILALFASGIHEVETIAAIAGARPSYVGSVLHREGLIDNYFDLYTSTAYPMNVYAKRYRGRLGFKTVEAAKESVQLIDSSYRYYERIADRAGQHHALEIALTMLDRARWTNKLDEAEVYRRWLVQKLSAPLVGEVDALALAPPADQQTESEPASELQDLQRAA